MSKQARQSVLERSYVERLLVFARIDRTVVPEYIISGIVRIDERFLEVGSFSQYDILADDVDDPQAMAAFGTQERATRSVVVVS